MKTYSVRIEDKEPQWVTRIEVEDSQTAKHAAMLALSQFSRHQLKDAKVLSASISLGGMLYCEGLFKIKDLHKAIEAEQEALANA